MTHRSEIGALTWQACQTCAHYRREPAWCDRLTRHGAAILLAELETNTMCCTLYEPPAPPPDDNQ